MTAKGYCDIDIIQTFTGTLTSDQAITANSMIEAAETYLDGEMGRGWLMGVQTLEPHYNPHENVILINWPIVSVQLVDGRAGLGETVEELTADEDYEVVDLGAGIIRLVSPGSWDRVRVSYTPVENPPADVARACAEIVANWMQPTLRPNSWGLDSYSLPDLTVKFSRTHTQTAATPFVQSVIERYRVPIAK